MAEFAYNNAKNASTGHTPFDLNCGYQPRVSYKKLVNSYSNFKTANELAAKFKDLIFVYRKNFWHIQKFWKRVYDKTVKPKNYI